MAEETTLKEEIQKLTEVISSGGIKKSKKFKLPLKAKVSKSKLGKGYVTVAVINENKHIDLTREPIVDSTIKVKDTFHAIDEEEIFFYKGKPFVFQAKNKLNPYNPLKGSNETYGQKYVMARMEGDKIITKKKMGWGIGIGVLVIIGIAVYYLLAGG